MNFHTGIGFPCQGANTTRSRAAHYEVYLPLHRTFWIEGWFAWLHYVPVEVVTTYEVLDLVLQIIPLLGIVPIIAVEVVITSAVPVLVLRPHQVRSFEESLFSDLEKNLSPSGVERDIRRPRNGLLTSLRPPPWEPRRWAPRGLSPRALLIFTFLRHQNLSGDILVGPLLHFWYGLGGCSTSDHKRREGLIPIMKAWMTNDGCALGMALISSIKRARYWPRCSSSYLIPRRDAAVGFGCVLERKLASNSLASDIWLHRPRGSDSTPGRNGVDGRQSRSSKAAHSVEVLLLSGAGRLLEAEGLAVGHCRQLFVLPVACCFCSAIVWFSQVLMRPDGYCTTSDATKSWVAHILRGHLSPPFGTFSAPKISPTSSAVYDDFYTRSLVSSLLQPLFSLPRAPVRALPIVS
ncbi:hypothetical protein BHE74_00057037 [Ensete ventricosum]|nr:hypothetical protein BHE74_00057037 [Ensete ventricosum]